MVTAARSLLKLVVELDEGENLAVSHQEHLNSVFVDRATKSVGFTVTHGHLLYKSVWLDSSEDSVALLLMLSIKHADDFEARGLTFLINDILDVVSCNFRRWIPLDKFQPLFKCLFVERFKLVPGLDSIRMSANWLRGKVGQRLRDWIEIIACQVERVSIVAELVLLVL